jgi:hypothetical protein
MRKLTPTLRAPVPILADTSTWNAFVAANSINAEPGFAAGSESHRQPALPSSSIPSDLALV